jgi:hypothetical protein
MSDPLSTAASIVALLTAFVTIADRVSGFIVAYKDAPAELMYLANEINDITLVLSLIRTQYPTLHAQNDPSNSSGGRGPLEHAALSLCLRLVSSKATELSDFTRSITAVSIHQGCTSLKTDKVVWATKKRKKAMKLQEQLRQLKVNLHGLLNVRTM